MTAIHPDRSERDAVEEASPIPAVRITVAISTRDRGDLIRETLEHLAEIRNPALVKILVIDQSGDDRTGACVRPLATTDPRIEYHRTSTTGLSAGRNLAMTIADTALIAYTDDDCIVDGGWLNAIHEELSDETVAMVTGRLLPWEVRKRTGIESGYKPTKERVRVSGPVPPWYVGHGGNLAVRRAVLQEIGGFDPVLGAGRPLRAAEDLDLIHRFLRTGHTIVYSPAMLVYHKQWKDWTEQRTMERAYGIGAGAAMAKYIRQGDRRGVPLFARWVWELGVRRVGAGLLKWRSRKVVYLGYCQLVYPWVGAFRSRRYPVDRRSGTFVDR